MSKILVIDDNLDFLSTTAELLKLQFSMCSVLTAKSGFDGIVRAKKEQPDVVLLDLEMPEVDGYEVCKKLKSDENTRHIPIIMITGAHTDSSSRVKGLNVGAVMFLTKPFSKTELTAQIKVALRIKAAEDLLREEKNLLEEIVLERTRALQESEERYRSFVKNFHGIAYKGKIDFIPIFFHGAVKEITGYDEREFLNGRPRWEELIHAEDLKAYHQTSEKIRKIANYIVEREYRILRKDSTIRWVSETIQNICDGAGNPTFVQGAIYDITRRKRVEGALRASEKKYRELVENSSEAIFVAQDGKLIFVNPAMVRLFGYSAEEITAKSLLEFIHPDDRKILSERGRAHLSNKYPSNCFRILRKDGRIRWVSLNAVRINWENRPGTLTFLNDITERRQAELIQTVLYQISNSVNTTEDLHALFKSIRTSLNKIIDTTNFFIALYDEKTDTLTLPFIVDEKDTFTSFPAGKSLTGYVIRKDKPLLVSKDEINRMTKEGIIEIVGTPCEQWLGVPLRISNKVIGALVVQSYDQNLVYTREHFEILKFVSDQIALAVDRKKGEEKIKASLKEKEVLLKEIHHRVKNNLQIISSLLYLQCKNITEESVLELFRDSQSRVKSMALIHENLYRSDDLTNIDFSDYIRTLINQLIQTFQTNGSQIKFNLDIKDVTFSIETAIPCGLIINELVSNSLKYAFPNGNPGQIDVALSSRNLQDDESERKNDYTLTVRDNGVGIPVDLDYKKTTSLGLQLVNNLTKQIGGTIELDRHSGTQFTIRFQV